MKLPYLKWLLNDSLVNKLNSDNIIVTILKISIYE